MNIVINALSARQGGGQTYLRNILNNLPSNFDGKVYLYAPESIGIKPANNIEVMSSHKLLSKPIMRVCWENIVLPRLLVKLEADCLFCPGGTIPVIVPKGCKKITMFRNMIPFDIKQRKRYPYGYSRIRNWILNKVMARSMLQADLTIFISEYARKVIQDFTKNRMNNSIVIPHGVNQSDFQNKKSRYLPEWLPPEGYILYVSSLEYYKAQIEVVSAYAILKQKENVKYKLLLVGPENAKYGKKVRKIIDNYNLQSDVLIVGIVPHEELEPIYRNAKVNIYASESENCPNILLESMAAGAITASSSKQPMPEFAGDAVLYFDPEVPQDIAESIHRILSSEQLQKQIITSSLERVKSYNWRETSIKTWSAIQDLINKREYSQT